MVEALGRAGVPVTLMLTDNGLIEMLNPKFIGEYFRDYVFRAKSGRPFPPARQAEKCVRASAIFGSGYMRDLHSAAGRAFDRASVVHNGVELGDSGDATARDRSRLREDGVVNLLFAGRVVEIKGVHTVVEAMKLLANAVPPGRRYRLTILGDNGVSDYQRQLTATAARWGCVDDIVFRPPVKAEQLFELFQEYDIYLFPSLYEPFSLTLIHALAAGIPTVASRVGGNVEIVEDGSTGVLFDHANAASLAHAIGRLYDGDDALRCRVAADGRTRARGFTFGRMLDRMEALLLEDLRLAKDAA